jgi:hypothetical protein
MRRHHRTSASAILFAACAILAVQSVRSYFWCDEVQGHLTGRQSFALTFWRGRITLVLLAATGEQVPWSASSTRYHPSWQPATATGIRGWLPAFVSNSSGWTTFGVIVPYWLLVLATGALVMISRLGWPPRFTLRSLLIASTFLAIELTMTVTLDHSYAASPTGNSPVTTSGAAAP